MIICEHKAKALKLRFFKGAAFFSSEKDSPKWKFHIEEICADCGKHLRFVPQTLELIESLNGRLLIENFLEGRESLFDKKDG